MLALALKVTSVYGKDMGADVVMKVVKQIPDENMNLVVFEEEYEMEDTANYDKAAEFLKTKGYEKFMKMLDHPYNLRYELLNTSVTFFPAPVTDNADNGTGDAGNSGKTADTVKLKGKKLGKVKSPKKAQIKVTWKKQTKQTTGYQIQYGTKSNFKGAKTVTISKNKTTSATIKKLKSKKKYFVRIRTFKKDGKKKSYSDWSKAKSVKVK